MRALIFFGFAVMAFGQPPVVERVFHLVHTESPQGLQQIANAMRAVSEVPVGSVDNVARTITVRGTAEEVGLADWLVPQLDVASGNSGSTQYQTGDAQTAVTRVFYLAQIKEPRAVQELVNAIRSITELQRVVAVTQPGAVVLRGTTEQVAATEWLVAGLDKAAGETSGPYTLTGTDRGVRMAPIMLIFSLQNTKTPQALQEIINAVRSVVEVQRVVGFNGLNSIVLRGSNDQIAVTEWLVNALDRPAGKSAGISSGDQPVAGTAEVARVFFPHSSTPEGLQSLTNQVRSEAHIMRAVMCQSPGGLVIRGTAAQIAIAEKIVRDRDATAN
jgi:hypothetical protein